MKFKYFPSLCLLALFSCSSSGDFETPSTYVYDHSELRGALSFVKSSEGSWTEISTDVGSPGSVFKLAKDSIETIVKTSPLFPEHKSVEFQANLAKVNVRFDKEILTLESPYTRENTKIDAAGDKLYMRLSDDFESLEVCTEIKYYTYKLPNGKIATTSSIDRCYFESLAESVIEFAKKNTFQTNDTIAIATIIQILKKK